MDRLKDGVRIEPDVVTFNGDLRKELRAQINITNKADQKLSYKIKVTNNELFRIQQSCELISPGERKTVSITFKPPEGPLPDPSRHHIGAYFVPAPEGCTALSVWHEHYGPAVVEKRIRISLMDTGRRNA